MTARGVGECGRCGRRLPRKGRGLCSGCYRYVAAFEDLDRYAPGRPNRRAQVGVLLDAGRTVSEIAVELGITVNAVACAARDIRKAAAQRAVGPVVREEWHEQAACAGLATRERDPWHPNTRDDALVAEAVAVCSSCPVAADCLRWALEHPDQALGIHAGLTSEQRARLVGVGS